MLFSIDVYSMKCPSVKLTKLLVRCLNVPWKSFYVNFIPLDLCLWPSVSSFGVTLLLHVDWMMLKNASNQGGVNSVIVAPLLTKSCPQMLVASRKLFGGQHLDFQQIFDWMPREEASTFQFICCSIWKPGDSNFLGKICLTLERSKMSFPLLTPCSHNV